MIPLYAEKGSKGPGIVPLLSFLKGQLASEATPEGFQADDLLGELGIKAVATFQKNHGLTVEGGCGPEMRAHMLECKGFDYELAVRSVGGTTEFVQPDGTVIKWSPELETESKVAAAAAAPIPAE